MKALRQWEEEAQNDGQGLPDGSRAAGVSRGIYLPVSASRSCPPVSSLPLPT